MARLGKQRVGVPATDMDATSTRLDAWFEQSAHRIGQGLRMLCALFAAIGRPADDEPCFSICAH
jgi:hypothetical protein